MTDSLRFNCLAVLLIFCSHCIGAEDSFERPNIVLIVADDLGYSDIGAYGGEINTPNLNALAQEGVQLTNYHTGPTCGPTRAMLLTGIDNHLAGAGINAAALMRLTQLRGRPGYEGYLSNRVVTFVSLLQDSGYHTYMTGKWDPGNKPGRLPVDHGFEQSFVLAAGGASHFSDAIGAFRPSAVAPYYENDKRVDKLPDDFYSSEFYTDRLIDYIESNDDEQPYMAYLSYTAPHWPLQVPDEWLNRYEGVYDDGWHETRAARFNRQKDLGVLPTHTQLPEQNRAVSDWDKLLPAQRQLELKRMELYAAMVENMDHHVGRFLKSVNSRDSERETIVIFVSDNGAEGNAINGVLDSEYWIPATFDNRTANLGRRGSYVWQGVGWAQASVSPFRLYKSYTTAGGIRTPGIFYSTGDRFATGKKHAVVTVRDIPATILDLADVAHPGKKYKGKKVLPMSGKSALTYLQGTAETVHGDEPLGWEIYGGRALIKGEWKAVKNFPPEGSGKWALFNIKTDPAETTDLSVDYPDVLSELATDWDSYAKNNGVAIFEEDLGYGRYRE